jgi:hypothetical protein
MRKPFEGIGTARMDFEPVRDSFRKTSRQVAEEQGLLGSKTEETWSGGVHTCCKSRSPWRHKQACPKVGDGTLPPDK